jgi:flavin-dependent dehydrogenase
MSQNLVIVGGGAAGPSAAAEAKRRNPALEVTMLEKGEFVSYAA